MKRFSGKYEDSISVQKLLIAWQEFLPGKKHRTDVVAFQNQLMDNILQLHRELKNKSYRHGAYHHFKIHDPKERDIHKATVRDRLVHHLLYRVLSPYFDSKYIHDSYSCRHEKGTHKALNRFREFARIVSQNHTKTCWVLKCDIKKFFANIDHAILNLILEAHIADAGIRWLFGGIISSFQSQNKDGVGVPLGNLTSQLLVNVYMNEFDQYMKRVLKVTYYIRYADDFVILADNREYLERIVRPIESFLNEKLHIELHPQKVSIATVASGIDFLGWVHFPDHRILRTATKRRVLKRYQDTSRTSYTGLLRHGNTYGFQKMLEERESVRMLG